MPPSPDSAPEFTLDARGLICPLPVLRAQRRLREMTQGQVLLLLTTDPASAKDVPDFCAEAGHELLSSETLDDGFRFRIQRGCKP